MPDTPTAFEKPAESPEAQRIRETLRVSAEDHLLTTELEGEFVILNTQTGTYYTLDGVGALVWRHIQQQNSQQNIQEFVTFAALCDAVTTAYEVKSGRCEEDVRALLSSLSEAGLVTLST